MILKPNKKNIIAIKYFYITNDLMNKNYNN